MSTVSITIQVPRSDYPSLQIGDTAFYVPTTPKSEFSTGELSNVIRLGEITEVLLGQRMIKVMWDNINVAAPVASDFIFFAKDRKVNTSSLVGYYAEVQFKNNLNGIDQNNPTDRAELFAVSSEITESSK